MPSLSFRGRAHPPPGKKRGLVADLNGAEIATTKMSNVDVLREHDHGDKVGKVHASWEGPHGELRVAGTLQDKKAIEQVKSGRMRGLSLGTSVLSDETGKALLRTQDELSICVEPRRASCYIDQIGSRKVHAVTCASALRSDRTRRYPPNAHNNGLPCYLVEAGCTRTSSSKVHFER